MRIKTSIHATPFYAEITLIDENFLTLENNGTSALHFFSTLKVTVLP